MKNGGKVMVSICAILRLESRDEALHALAGDARKISAETSAAPAYMREDFADALAKAERVVSG